MLAQRTESFAQAVRTLVKKLPKTHLIIEDCKQLLRSSGSIAANYLEAKEALSRNDFLYRIRIVRKESFETRLWLVLAQDCVSDPLCNEYELLVKECTEFTRLFSAIAKTTQQNAKSPD